MNQITYWAGDPNQIPRENINWKEQFWKLQAIILRNADEEARLKKIIDNLENKLKEEKKMTAYLRQHSQKNFEYTKKRTFELRDKDLEIERLRKEIERHEALWLIEIYNRAD